MTFTPTPPTVPGAYWWKADVHLTAILRIVEQSDIDCKLYNSLNMGLWSRLVPVEEVEKAYKEGWSAYDFEDTLARDWNNSRAKQIVDGGKE